MDGIKISVFECLFSFARGLKIRSSLREIFHGAHIVSKVYTVKTVTPGIRAKRRANQINREPLYWDGYFRIFTKSQVPKGIVTNPTMVAPSQTLLVIGR